MNYSAFPPAEIRALIRAGKLDAPTTGCCDGYAQGNLVVLPKALAWDFLLFCQRNPKACPLLEVADAGDDFLNLNNGLFLVNCSNDQALELTLTAPEHFDGQTRSFNKACKLKLLYPFGAIHFIIEF